MYLKKRKENVWQEILSSKFKQKEKVSTIVKNILKIATPISLCAIFSATTKTIDALTIVRILKNYIGEEKATLQYGILSGKVDMLIMLPFSFNTAFATALVPTIAGAIAKNKIDVARRRIKLSILISILIGIPCSILMSCFSYQILCFLFPNASSGCEMLKYSAWSIIFVVIIQTINGALQGMGKLHIPVIAFAIGSIIKLILNIVLIPKLQINGSIISTIASHFITFIICFKSLIKYANIKFEIDRFFVKPIIAGAIMILFLNLFYRYLGNYFTNNFLFIFSLIISIFIYIISILFFKIIKKDEIIIMPYGKKLYKVFKI